MLCRVHLLRYRGRSFYPKILINLRPRFGQKNTESVSATELEDEQLPPPKMMIAATSYAAAASMISMVYRSRLAFDSPLKKKYLWVD